MASTSKQSCIYHGRVRHRRLHPIQHEFEFPMFMVYLDLAELDDLFKRYWLWSSRHFNLAWFRRADHSALTSDTNNSDKTLRDVVESETGSRPQGPIRLLTHLRYFGYLFNPVSFYYFFDQNDQHVEFLIAEVSNTPWREQHCYVLQRQNDAKHPQLLDASFDKAFHVSPFIPMDCAYRIRAKTPADHLSLHLEMHRHQQLFFDATLNLQRKPISSTSLAWALMRYPFLTLQVITAIHWQGVRLWQKGATVYTHPKKKASQ